MYSDILGVIMNAHDRGNLDFLLTANEATMESWYKTASADDVAYALELLHTNRVEYTMRDLEALDEIEDVGQASELLAQFCL